MKTLLLSMLVSFSTLAATVVPFERDESRLPRPAYMTSNNHASEYYSHTYVGDEQENEFFYSFSLMNMGTNDIVTTTATGIDFAYRDYDFVTDDHSRRDTFLWITDYNGSGRMSDMFETVMVFLPRENQMHVEETATELLVTLVTGEEVVFSKTARTITSGVLQEQPMDLNPTRSERKFAGVTYSGKGLVIRSDVRASDPRLTKNVQILKKGLAPCEVRAKHFWTEDGFPSFRFVTDDETYKKIAELCGQEYIK
jgi:hypothetical protein